MLELNVMSPEISCDVPDSIIKGVEGELGEDVLGDSTGILLVTSRKQQNEFIAAESADDVFTPRSFLHDLR